MDRSQTSSQNNLACIKAFLKERLLQKANIPEIENKIQHLISRKKCLEEEIKLKNDEAINIENYVLGINEKIAAMSNVHEDNKKLKDNLNQLEARLKFEEGRRDETAHEIRVMKGSFQLKDEEIRIAKECQKLKDEEIRLLKEKLLFKDAENMRLTFENVEKENQNSIVQVEEPISIQTKDEAEIITQNTDEDTDEDMDMAEWDSLQDDILLDVELVSTGQEDATLCNQEPPEPVSMDCQESEDSLALSQWMGTPDEVMPTKIDMEGKDHEGKLQQQKHNMREDTYETLLPLPTVDKPIIDDEPVNVDELLKNMEDECNRYKEINDSFSSDYTVEDYNLDEQLYTEAATPSVDDIANNEIESKRTPKKEASLKPIELLSLKRRASCDCEGCSKEDCMQCRYCLDRPSNGGPGTLRHRCVHRTCLKKHSPNFEVKFNRSKSKSKSKKAFRPEFKHTLHDTDEFIDVCKKKLDAMEAGSQYLNDEVLRSQYKNCVNEIDAEFSKRNIEDYGLKLVMTDLKIITRQAGREIIELKIKSLKNEIMKHTSEHRSIVKSKSKKRIYIKSQCPFPNCGKVKSQRSALKEHIASFHLKKEIKDKFPFEVGQPCTLEGCQFVNNRTGLYYYHYAFSHGEAKRIYNGNDEVGRYISQLP